MKAYCGKILRVDLSRRDVTAEGLDEAHLRDYLGQVGLAARFLYDEVGPEVEPFSPGNRLIFMTGPLTGTAAPASARYEVVAVSPQTAAYGEANSGGLFGPELKFAGFDGIIF
ncbi:MAG: aldehyde ferredoxin oxidoreductase N-terminal domain-containing protein, partial [Nitrospinota bacterium]